MIPTPTGSRPSTCSPDDGGDRDVGEPEQVDDHGDGEDREDQRVGAGEGKAVGQGAHESGGDRRRSPARRAPPEAERVQEARAVEDDGDGVDAGDAVPMEQRSSHQGAEGAGGVDGGHVEAHRNREPRVAHRVAEHGPAYR